jgi:hypothetical protein
MAEPTSRFPRRADAAWYLGGIAGFWGGVAAVLLTALAVGHNTTSPIWIVPIVLVTVGVVALQVGLRRLEYTMRGRAPRAWPFGYLRMSTMIHGLLPRTMVAAGERLGLNGAVVAAALYVLLALDLVLLLTGAPSR